MVCEMISTSKRVKVNWSDGHVPRDQHALDFETLMSVGVVQRGPLFGSPTEDNRTLKHAIGTTTRRTPSPV